MEVSEAASNVTYKIDDRTGPWIDVKRWMDEQVCVCDLFFFCVAKFLGCYKQNKSCLFSR